MHYGWVRWPARLANEMWISTTFGLHDMRCRSMPSACTVRAQCVHGDWSTWAQKRATSVQHRGEKPSAPPKPSRVPQGRGVLSLACAVASRPRGVQGAEVSYAEFD